MLLIIRQYLFNNKLIAFDFITLCNSKSNRNNLIEVLFIGSFLVDCLMCLNISLIVSKISKFSLSGLVCQDQF